MAERPKGVPDDIQQAITEAPIDWEALQTSATRLRWKVPESFDDLFRSVLKDYATSITRCLWYSAANAMVQEQVPSAQLLSLVAQRLLKDAETDVVRTKYEFGYGLGQDAGLNHVATAIFKKVGIPIPTGTVKKK